MKEFLILEMIILWSVRYFYICCSIVMVYVRSLSDWWYVRHYSNRHTCSVSPSYHLLAASHWSVVPLICDTIGLPK